MKYFIVTFGCQMNENDSERLAGLLRELDARPAASPEDSDLIIVNTCAVRQKSEEKLLSLLGRLEKIKKRTKARIAVVGCVAQLHGEDLLKKRPGIDFIIGPDNYGSLPGLLSPSPDGFVSATGRSRLWKEIDSSTVLHRSPFSASITIMEGCDHFCSYCVVPFVRGREKSRPMTFITKEIRDLERKGYREILFLGQNVNSYRDPDSGAGFIDLLGKLEDTESIRWVRFVTSHPRDFTRDLAEVVAADSRICRQLHLPVQSGSTEVLRRMNRGYTREEYLKKIAFLRELMPDISMSTDIIVGYPGETEEEHRQTLRLLEEIRFANIFSFRYSPRPRTAASMEVDSVPLEVKKRRLIEVQSLQKEIQTRFHASFLGQTVRVLCTGCDKKKARRFSGRNEGFQVVNFDSNRDLTGTFVDVLITSAGPYSLHGRALEQQDR